MSGPQSSTKVAYNRWNMSVELLSVTLSLVLKLVWMTLKSWLRTRAHPVNLFHSITNWPRLPTLQTTSVSTACAMMLKAAPLLWFAQIWFIITWLINTPNLQPRLSYSALSTSRWHLRKTIQLQLSVAHGNLCTMSRLKKEQRKRLRNKELVWSGYLTETAVLSLKLCLLSESALMEQRLSSTRWSLPTLVGLTAAMTPRRLWDLVTILRWILLLSMPALFIWKRMPVATDGLLESLSLLTTRSPTTLDSLSPDAGNASPRLEKELSLWLILKLT